MPMAGLGNQYWLLRKFSLVLCSIYLSSLRFFQVKIKAVMTELIPIKLLLEPMTRLIAAV